MTRPTVYVVDDDDAVRRSLELWLHSLDMDARGFPSGEAFLSAYEHRTPACLVADLRMPRMTGLELQDSLLARGIRIPIIFLSGHGTVRHAVQAMEQGAVDFLEKPFEKGHLRERITKALEQHALESDEADRVQGIRARYEALTRRQREVFERVIDGKPNKVVAAELNLAEKTVELHRSKMMRCMEADSLAELVRMAVSLDLGRESV